MPDTQTAAKTIPVTADNFIRAESDLYLGNVIKEGGFGKFYHRREPENVDHQIVVRLNRDTLYSGAVFDLDAAPVTITMPDARGRFMSLFVVNEDEYVVSVSYDAGPHAFTREQAGTRYILVGLRTLVDPEDPADIAAVHILQDAVTIEQANSGTFDIPAWDPASQKRVRDALLVLGSTLPDFAHAFGSKTEVDPVRHLIAAASAWGGNPDKDATYLNVTPAQNDGTTTYRLMVGDVPVDGFWSVIVYTAEGYIPKNDRGVYSFNSLTAKKQSDGSIIIQFGGDPAQAANQIPIVPGWNYMVRLYRPRDEILRGAWKFPEATVIH